MNIKMLVMLLLVISTVVVYAEGIDVFVHGGKFENLPENMKLKIKKIYKEFDNEPSFIVAANRRSFSVLFNNNTQNQEVKNEKMYRNNYREAFIAAVQAIKMNDKDSNAIKSAIEVYVKNGLELFETVGYPNRPGYSLKIDNYSFQMYDPLSKEILENGVLYFDEYYNGIRILDSQGSIHLLRGSIDCIALNVIANQEDVKITNTIPEVSLRKALKKYLSSSKKIKLGSKPMGELCYIGGQNNSLKLCWKIDISVYEGSKTV